MKKLILKLLLLFIIILVIDSLFSLFLDMGRPRDYQLFIDSKNQFDYGKGYDIICMGDSHTADAVVPSVVSEGSGLSCFNFGVYHQSPLEEYFLVQDILSLVPRRPEYILLGTNPEMFCRKVTAGKYTPMFIRNPAVFTDLLKTAKTQNFSIFTSSGKKMDLLKPAFKVLMTGKKLDKVKRKITKTDNGYLVNISQGEDEPQEANSSKTERVDAQEEYFRKTVKFIKEKNIKVIIFNPPLTPQYRQEVENMEFYRDFHGTINKIAGEEGIEVFNKNQELDDKFVAEDFFNPTHLNYNGADKFSRLLREKVKKE